VYPEEKMKRDLHYFEDLPDGQSKRRFVAKRQKDGKPVVRKQRTADKQKRHSA